MQTNLGICRNSPITMYSIKWLEVWIDVVKNQSQICWLLIYWYSLFSESQNIGKTKKVKVTNIQNVFFDCFEFIYF